MAHSGWMNTVLTPMLALVCWTLVMWFWMYATRLPAMKQAGIDATKMKEQADKVLDGMNQILGAAGALLADFNYALMSAQSLAEVVASVIAGAELLKQAKADPRRFDLAASWINRRMNDLESRCKRIKEGSVDRLDRADAIIALKA